MSEPVSAPVLTELILYACPSGPLAQQIEAYFDRSRLQYGANRAHAYMPHCTLTGFFHDRPSAIPEYVQAAQQALNQHPNGTVTIDQLRLKPDWHGLELTSPWLEQVAATFAAQGDSATRTDAIRLKTWLHLSLAYGFDKAQHGPLSQLAENMIDPTQPVTWQIRFYERQPEGRWTCHWPGR
ncbi:MAG: hypothetical protein AAFU71_11420 [Cyanobacteria bacterium J06632_22]